MWGFNNWSIFYDLSGESQGGEDDTDEQDEVASLVAMWDEWAVDDIKRLLDFMTSLFLSNFAVYVAHKVMTAHNMEVYI